MAAACNVADVKVTEEHNENGQTVDSDIIDAHIVAQAITELQEVQGPLLHIQENNSIQPQEVADLVADIQSNRADGDPAETHVIYYIDSNGSFTGSLEKSFVDSSVQANDYEIERRSGKVPARKRIIPSKFRDYKNTSNDEDSDSDFDPHEYTKKVRKVKPAPRTSASLEGESTEQSNVKSIPSSGKGRGVGRPRKNFMPTASLKEGSIPQEQKILPPSAEVERKLQEAIRLSEQEAQKEAIDQTCINSTESMNKDTVGDNQEQSTQPDGKIGSLPRSKPELVYIGKRGRGRPKGPVVKRVFKCPDCGKSFNQKANLKVHLFTHTQERPFPCVEEGCDKSFRSNEALRRHLLSHQGIKPFECTVCNKRFSSNVALVEHMSIHTNEKPYQCPHCPGRFRQVSCLRRHISTHSDEQPYECAVCHRQFSQPAYLRSHMKVHTGEKPYKCDICDKRFAYQSDVKRHKTTHTGEKPYSCSKCQAKFSDVSSKNRHEKEHENSKRYTCHLCPDTFKRTGQLRSHLHRRHSSHLVSVEVEKNVNDGVFSFKMGEESDSSSVYVSQKRILSLIKGLQNKGFTDIENIQLVGVSDVVNGQRVGTNLAPDISQLEKEVDASVIEDDVAVPVELQGVEVQGEADGHTYIAVNDYTGPWTQGEKSDTAIPVQYQKVEVITEDGQSKEILVPCDPGNADIDIQVAYSTTVDQHPDVITIDGPLDQTTEVPLDSTGSEQSSVVTHTVENVNADTEKTLRAIATLRDIEAVDKVTTYEVKEKVTVERETEYLEQENNAGDCVRVESVVIDSGGIISLNPNVDKNIATDCNTHTQDVTKQTFGTTQTEENNIKIENFGKFEYDITGGGARVVCDVENSQSENLNETVISKQDNGPDNSSSIDYVLSPDFGSQDYYNWLSKFTELCKVVPLPLDMSLFQKISQVHKTLSDVMANPSGVVADRENFRVLMNISRELSTIINEHLAFVLENLNHDLKSDEGSSADLPQPENF